MWFWCFFLFTQIISDIMSSLIELILSLLDDVCLGVTWRNDLDCPKYSFGFFFDTEALLPHDSAAIAFDNTNTHFNAYLRYSIGYRTNEPYNILYTIYGTGLRNRFFMDLVMQFNVSKNICVLYQDHYFVSDRHMSDESDISNGGAIRVYGWARVPFTLLNYLCSYLLDIPTCSKSGSDIFVDFLRNPNLSTYRSSNIFSHAFSNNLHANVNINWITNMSYPQVMDSFCHTKWTPWTSVGFLSEFCVMNLNGNTDFIVSFEYYPLKVYGYSPSFWRVLFFEYYFSNGSECMVSFITKIRIW